MINMQKWDTIRIIKAIAGISGIILAIIFNSIILGVLGAMVSFQALTNTGCGACSTSSCTINTDKTKE